MSADNGEEMNDSSESGRNTTKTTACSRLVPKLRQWRVRLTVVLVLLIIVGGICLIALNLITAGMALFFAGFLALFIIFAIDSLVGKPSSGADGSTIDGFTVISIQDGAFERCSETPTLNDVSHNTDESPEVPTSALANTAVVWVGQTGMSAARESRNV